MSFKSTHGRLLRNGLPPFYFFVMLIAMSKALLYGSVLIFSTIGSYVPVLWHAGFLSMSSLIGGVIGTIIGIWAALKVNDYVDF